MTIRSVRGTKDLLPEVTPHWHLLEDEARRLAHQCGYEEIRTAMFEPVELFTRGLGATAGLVERELWTFHDKHGRKLALRAELTAPVARAFHEHSLSPGPGGVFKVYYLAPVFLFGREGEMESRQVHQFGVEALGSEEPALDAECIYLAWEFCRAVGLVGMSLELNSLGCDRCRPGYHQALKDYFHGRADELCPTCKRRYKSHPLWSLGCPQPGCHALASVAPSIFAHLCAPCRSHFGSLKFYLEEMAIPYQVDLRVVRDIEYYNRTIFQLRCGERVLATGGRYDGLVEAVGGPAAPAVGMAVELEAVLECLYASGIELPQAPPLQVLLAGEGPESREVLVPMLYRLRRAGIASDLCYGSCDLDQLQVAAEKVGARLVAVLEE
ncbi:MAG TPA: histidine--tRNA ligase, partial [Candidatus Nitrosotenuis sp.]|nr:histidine--tRNA ligase [Candidatus Nitrosotenuis sp.]